MSALLLLVILYINYQENICFRPRQGFRRNKEEFDDDTLRRETGTVYIHKKQYSS